MGEALIAVGVLSFAALLRILHRAMTDERPNPWWPAQLVAAYLATSGLIGSGLWEVNR